MAEHSPFPTHPAIESDGYTPATSEEIGIIPMAGRILVEMVRFGTKKDHALFLDATVEQPTEHGVVLAMASNVETDAKVGDVVMFGRYSGYSIDEERFAMIRIDDVVAIRTSGIVKPKTLARPDLGIVVPDRRIVFPS